MQSRRDSRAYRSHTAFQIRTGRLAMPQSYANLIDGEMVTTARSLDVINPATEEVIGQVPACGKEELDRAVAAARRWRRSGGRARRRRR